MNTVQVLAHRRSHYLRQTLAALERCDQIEAWRVLICMDRPDTETRYLVAHTDPRWETVELDLGNAADEPYARVSRATLMALALGFATSDFVAHLEEDVIPASDYLTWMGAMAERYRDDPEVFTVNPWSGPDTGGIRIRGTKPTTFGNAAGDASLEHLDRHFTPWGWGTWHDRFLELRQSWDFAYWDRHLNERIRGTRFGVFPPTSKVRDIGEHDGVNPPEEWRARNEGVPV